MAVCFAPQAGEEAEVSVVAGEVAVEAALGAEAAGLAAVAVRGGGE